VDHATRSAAAIPGATVTILNAATRAERATTTDRTGTYRFIALPPGTYQIRVELQGFSPAVRDRVAIAVDTTSRLEPIVLTVGGVNESVEVQASVAMSTADATLGNVIESRQILALPLEARNPVSLMSLQPGAVFLPTGDPRSGAISGARSRAARVAGRFHSSPRPAAISFTAPATGCTATPRPRPTSTS